MPRSARAAVAGQCYHLINRGNARARVFASAADYRAFVELIDEAQHRIELDLFGVCLMSNHFHLLASPRGDWVRQPIGSVPCYSNTHRGQVLP